MKVYVNWVSFDVDIDKIEEVNFYYDSKTHRWKAYVGHGTGDEFEISEKKGKAIIEFLKWLSQESKKLSSVGPGDEETFDMVHDEEIFDFQGEVP